MLSDSESPREIDAFVSYANEDKELADLAIARLERDGIACWISHRDARPGGEWAESIVDAIENCKIVILIYSEHSNGSQQVLREMERAVRTNVPILPYLSQDHPLSPSMSYFLGATHWLNVANSSTEAGIDKLANAIGPILRAEARGLRPGSIVLPTPVGLRNLYISAIVVPIVVFALGLLAGSEAMMAVGLIAADAGVPFGTYGLLWGRASWGSSLFAAALFVLGTIFIVTVIMPLL